MKKSILFFLLIISTISFSQTSSPYTRFGMGKMLPQEQAHLRAMGYLSAAYVDSIHSNLSNPAALGNKNFSSIDVALNLGYYSQQDADATNDLVDGGVSYLAYSFPVNSARTWGMALGVQPFSTKKYDISSEPVEDTYFTDYEGDGNTYKLFLQNGFEIGDSFRIGGEAGLFFGTLKDATYNNFLNSGANGSGLRESQKLRGFMFSIGSQYTSTIGENLELTIGGNYRLEADINNDVTSEDFLFQIADFDVREDGIIEILERNEFGVEENTSEETLTVPGGVDFGAYLNKSEKWSLGVNAEFGLWEDFQGSNDHSSVQYQNSMNLSIGGSFIPDFRNPAKAYEGWEYRYGGHYSNTYLNIEGANINEYGITLGVSLPLMKNIPGSRVRSIPSSIDVGLDIGQYGTLDNDLMQESYIKGTVGLNLNDIWFQKKQYD